MNRESQKGISVFISISIIAIVLIIVLGVAIIVASEIRISRHIGNSVVAFFVADSGIEKTFYYDRKVIPMGASRGFCNMCSVCDDCRDCHTEGDDCSAQTCSDCKFSFYETFNSKKYKVEAETDTEGNLAETIIKSYGYYRDTTRAIELSFVTETGPPPGSPVISNTLVTPRSVPFGVILDIRADISDPDGVSSTSTVAIIQRPDENNLEEMMLILSQGTYNDGTFVTMWSGPEGSYYVDIIACDIKGNCSEAENI